MVNFGLLEQQHDAYLAAEKSYSAFLQAQKAIVIDLFKSLIRTEYRASTYVHDVHFKADKHLIEVYLFIKNPVPTEQDHGLIFKFSTADIDGISNRAELFNQLVSGDRDYLAL